MGARVLGPVRANAQWTSGYWADAQVSEIEYLPEPPATAEAGPNKAAASADQTWLPGSWVWQQTATLGARVSGPRCNGLGLGPGPLRPRPARYVYVSGYWDYSVARRGVLFAPVHFAADTYARPGFSYSRRP